MDVWHYQRHCWTFGNVSERIINHRIRYLFIAGKEFFGFNSRISISCCHLFSAGVGRSGTFIALDALLEQAEHQDIIDVLEFTHRMR